MLLTCGANGLPMSTTASPSRPNHAPHASMTFPRSASVAGIPPPVYTRTKFAIHATPYMLIRPREASRQLHDEQEAAFSTAVDLLSDLLSNPHQQAYKSQDGNSARPRGRGRHPPRCD